MTTPSLTHEELWERIQSALDQRLDPLDDPQLAAALADAPELAEELVLLMESLEYLTPELVRPRRSAALLAVAASCLLAWGTWRLAPGLQTAKAPALAEAEAPTVLPLRTAAVSFELIIEHQDSAGRRRLVHTDSGLHTEFESSPPHRRLKAAPGSSRPMTISVGDVVTYEHTTAHPFTN
ncbi:MAG: hypothetical protein ACI8QC_000219 [Planctomycetota bacterium]|jgi:hypothetical protein